MRIVVNDIAATSGGALSILRSFYEYLAKNDCDNEWIFLLSDHYIEDTPNIKVLVLDNVKKNWINRLKFDCLDGKDLMDSLKPDVIFSLQNTMIFGLKIPQLIYMHQPIPFQKEKKFSFFKSNERKLFVYQYGIGYLIKKSLRKASHIIVQTEWIRQEVIRSTKINSNKVTKIFPDIGDCSIYVKEEKFDKNSFFYPSADYLYKNHECIYKAVTILGKKNVGCYNIELTITDENQREHISNIGQISYSSVLEKYNTSTLIFPSYIETVGLPMLEARQMGAIILASDCSFSREVLNGYENAYYFNPFNAEELADLIEKVINGKIIRKKIANQTKMHLINSWEQVKNLILHISGGSNN